MGTGSDFAVEGRGKRVVLVVSRYNERVTAELAAGARQAFLSAGVAAEDVKEFSVAGVFEIAPACRQILSADREVDAIVALGALVRGETPHFDVLAHTVAQSLQQLANEIAIPLAFGVLTCDSLEQAEARADRSGLDRGGEAARAALAQAALFEKLQERRPAVRGFRRG
jgi:6,7-dimethyl-8-ribityllumazine synthase